MCFDYMLRVSQKLQTNVPGLGISSVPRVHGQMSQDWACHLSLEFTDICPSAGHVLRPQNPQKYIPELGMLSVPRHILGLGMSSVPIVPRQMSQGWACYLSLQSADTGPRYHVLMTHFASPSRPTLPCLYVLHFLGHRLLSTPFLPPFSSVAAPSCLRLSHPTVLGPTLVLETYNPSYSKLTPPPQPSTGSCSRDPRLPVFDNHIPFVLEIHPPSSRDPVQYITSST